MQIFKLNTEYPEENEEELIAALREEFLRYYEEENPPKKQACRGTHPKTVIFVRAEFIVEPDLPPELSVGLFKETKTFAAWIRFSQTFTLSDEKRDCRSCSIKVLDVPDSGSQDFLMRSHPTFYVRCIRDFLELLRRRKNPLPFFFPSLNPMSWRLRELWIIISQMKRFSNLLSIQYWSDVPSHFGSKAMKFSVKPHFANTWKHHISPSKDFLHEVGAQFLKTQEACFDFLVQFQEDPEKQPIEDATVRWDSPFYKVATVRIPAQDIDDPNQVELAERASFNPWHTIPEHQPLGRINRARRHIYPMISSLRHKRNNVPDTEI